MIQSRQYKLIEQIVIKQNIIEKVQNFQLQIWQTLQQANSKLLINIKR